MSDNSPTPVEPWMKLETMEQLIANEQQIIAKMDALPNGGLLFVLHPFLLLADIGVEISADLKQVLIQRIPTLRSLSESTYYAVRRTQEPQINTYHFKRLFPGDEQ
jgi:hypothetical protein